MKIEKYILKRIKKDLQSIVKTIIKLIKRKQKLTLKNGNHFNENVIITRKGAVRARTGDFGIIPGSMGARSFIVKGKGSEESFCSCSHGAGRKMSRTKARANFTKEDLVKATEGIECRKDEGVIDEIPQAYKDIQEVIENQSDLVEVVAELKQIMCVKG